MPSIFNAIDAATQAAMEHVFGESITVRPMAGDPNYGPQVDAGRPVKPGVSAIVSLGADARGADYSNAAQNGAAMAQQSSEIWLSAAAYAALGYELRKGDVVELEDGRLFTIAPMPPNDQGDVQVKITGGAP